MLNAMKWLVKDAKAHDSLFFIVTDSPRCSHRIARVFGDSGHGGRLPDQKGDEVDGYDDGE
jgi:hypothetical protein